MVENILKEINVSKIRMERARPRISQKELAEKVKISREKVNAIENKKCKKAKYELLENIANTFNLKVEDLLKKKRDNVRSANYNTISTKQRLTLSMK